MAESRIVRVILEVPTAAITRSFKLDFSQGLRRRAEEEVALEAPCNIYLNDKLAVTLFASPNELDELGIGHMLAEGVLKSADDIADVQVNKTGVQLKVADEHAARLAAARNFKVISSACGSVDDFYSLLDRIEKPYVTSQYRVDAEEVMRMVREMNKLTSSYTRNIAVHSAALFEQGQLAVYREDVGRHNAVDKVIGAAALKKLDFSNSILMTTGRQPADMVLKAARMGVPISVSIRGPIYSGIFAAWKTGVTMISFARGPGMAVYTYAERISIPEGMKTL